jgi:hypothetical protein
MEKFPLMLMLAADVTFTATVFDAEQPLAPVPTTV